MAVLASRAAAGGAVVAIDSQSPKTATITASSTK